MNNHIKFFFLLLIIILQMTSCKIPEVIDKVEEPAVQELEPNAEYTLIKKWDINAKIIHTDKLLNAYLVTENNELIKYNQEGKELFRYSDYELGNITHLDCQNPFNILVYYGDFQTIIILDNRLYPTHQVELYETNSPQVKTLCVSNDQNIWLFDEVNAQLKKINQKGEIVFESPLMHQMMEDEITPDFLLEHNEQIYAADKDLGIFVFDNFGKYLYKESQINTDKFQLIDNIFIYLYQNTANLYNSRQSISEQIVLPKDLNGIIDMNIQKNQMYIIDKNTFRIYTFVKNND